jgi:acetyltransferase
MQSIIEYARSKGLRRIEGQVLAENATMLRMCSELGFQISADPNEDHIRAVALQLAP